MKSDNNDIRVVWLDLDDTLIDFTTNSRLALTKMRADEPLLSSLFPDAAVWVETYERHNMALWAEYNMGRITRDFLRQQRFIRPLLAGGCQPDEAREAARRYDTLYLDYLAREKQLMPGAIDLLRSLRSRGLTIGILSNGFKEVQYRKITNAGLAPWIDLTVLSDDIDVNKPDPRIFAYAMTRAGDTDPAHHIMIGDNPATDISGALAAGWRAVWYHPERAFAGTPCPAGAAEVTRLPAIPPLLGQSPDTTSDAAQHP